VINKAISTVTKRINNMWNTIFLLFSINDECEPRILDVVNTFVSICLGQYCLILIECPYLSAQCITAYYFPQELCPVIYLDLNTSPPKFKRPQLNTFIMKLEKKSSNYFYLIDIFIFFKALFI